MIPHAEREVCYPIRTSTRSQEDKMKRTLPFLFAGVVLTLALPAFVGVSRANDKPKAVIPVKTWGGLMKIELRGKAPNYIANKEAWAKFWKLYRGDEKLPAVDFEKQLIVVVVNNDPNGISAMLELDAKGDLKIDYASTEIKFINPTTCAYQVALIPRAGIKTIMGVPIAKD
jgi:hypothetical protein